MKKTKYRLQKDATLLTFSIFILSAAWISFSIYHTHVTSTISDTLQMRIKPITGRFDNNTINKLKSRIPVKPDTVSPLSTESARQGALDLIPSPTPSVVPVLPTSSIAPTAIPVPATIGTTPEVTP